MLLHRQRRLRRLVLERLEARALPATLVAAPVAEQVLLSAPPAVPPVPVQPTPDAVFAQSSGPMGGDLAAFLARTAPYFDSVGLVTEVAAPPHEDSQAVSGAAPDADEVFVAAGVSWDWHAPSPEEGPDQAQ